MTQASEEQEEQQQPVEPTQHEVPPDLAQTEFPYADHRTYSQAIYEQPVWVVDAVFGPGGLNQNELHTPANVQVAINQMMQQPDKQFEGVQ